MANSQTYGFQAYLSAFTARWFIAMSGPLSVPAAALAFLVQSPAAKIAFGVTAIGCFVFSSYWIWRIEREARQRAENDLAAANDFAESQWGNVRVADNPAAIGLFLNPGPERNKFLSLLAGFHLTAWARPMGGHEDLLVIEGNLWQKLAFFDFAPKRDDAPTINQTYIRRNNDKTALYYDVYLNLRQMQRVWPNIDLKAEG